MPCSSLWFSAFGNDACPRSKHTSWPFREDCICRTVRHHSEHEVTNLPCKNAAVSAIRICTTHMFISMAFRLRTI
ncbi:unnamed protein product [Haemonchus placei]|uniref:Uncharacterized protein n=1 Tax=Haemonchus placei TaxID=6290 RepID=A0A3P7YQZ2_HAEPC|nr:unnamed protein product [Haemonchus placei]